MTAVRWFFTSLRGARILLVALLGFTLIMLAVGCTPPRLIPPANMTADHRGRFDAWIADHTTTVHESIGFAAGYTLPNTTIIHYDDAIIARWDAGWPGMGEWVTIHEQAHQVAFRLGLMIGDGPCTIIACPPAERAAQCVTEVVLGHGPPWTDDTKGYWDCPLELVTSTRRAMVGIGAW